MEYILLLAVVVVLYVFKDRPVMVLKFENGQLIKVKGDIPAGFKKACKDIAHKTPFTGHIKVYKNRYVTKLNFSKSIPTKIKQRIRNVFPHHTPSSKHGNRA